MTKTWEQGAFEASERIINEFSDFPHLWEGVARTTLFACLDDDLDYLREAYFDGTREKGIRDTHLTRSMANVALELLWRNTDDERTPDNFRDMAESVVLLAAGKQHDYGQGNINAFGKDGVIVRLSDKVERLKNLEQRFATVAYGTPMGAMYESFDDTLMDIYGYAVIFDMLDAGTFGLPLRADVPTSGQTEDRSSDLSVSANIEANLTELLERMEEFLAQLDDEVAAHQDELATMYVEVPGGLMRDGIYTDPFGVDWVFTDVHVADSGRPLVVHQGALL